MFNELLTYFAIGGIKEQNQKKLKIAMFLVTGRLFIDPVFAHGGH